MDAEECSTIQFLVTGTLTIPTSPLSEIARTGTHLADLIGRSVTRVPGPESLSVVCDIGPEIPSTEVSDVPSDVGTAGAVCDAIID